VESVRAEVGHDRVKGGPPAVTPDSGVARPLALGRWVDIDSQPPLTTCGAASYDRIKPILINVRSPIGANLDVFRAVPVHTGRGWMFLLWGLLCLLGGVKSSQAAGCHMQDRIMLRSTLSWEKELAVDLSADPLVQLPPVLAEPPCPGEVPHVLDSDGAWTSPALFRPLRSDPPGLSDCVSFQFPSEPIRPWLMRLDRPPRTNLSRAAVERLARTAIAP
jgi:hypothetical protein